MILRGGLLRQLEFFRGVLCKNKKTCRQRARLGRTSSKLPTCSHSRKKSATIWSSPCAWVSSSASLRRYHSPSSPPSLPSPIGSPSPPAPKPNPSSELPDMNELISPTFSSASAPPSPRGESGAAPPISGGTRSRHAASSGSTRNPITKPATSRVQFRTGSRRTGPGSNTRVRNPRFVSPGLCTRASSSGCPT